MGSACACCFKRRWEGYNSVQYPVQLCYYKKCCTSFEGCAVPIIPIMGLAEIDAENQARHQYIVDMFNQHLLQSDSDDSDEDNSVKSDNESYCSIAEEEDDEEEDYFGAEDVAEK